MAEYRGDDNDLVVLSDRVTRLGLTSQLSPSRDRYFCVEVVSTQALSLDSWETPPYMSIESFKSWEQPIPPLGHDELAYRLRVYTLSGELVKAIPIERLYSALYSRGKWLSDRMIVLQMTGRWSVLWTLVIDTQRDKKFLLSGVDEIKATSSGCVVWQKGGALFADFLSIYPFSGEEFLDLADRESWERFRQRHYVEKKPFFAKRPELAEHSLDGWVLTPDEQRLLVLDKHPKGQRPPQLVWIDLGKISTVKNLADYSRIEVLPDEPESVLLRDDNAREIAVHAPHRRVLWRRSFADLAAP